MKRILAYDVSEKDFVLCMKGIEVSTGSRLSEVLTESGISPEHIAVWVGPGHIQAFTQGIPNCMVIDSASDALKRRLADNFKSDLIRFYYGSDLIGTEIGAAAKNVMGIVAGVLDGCGYVSLKGSLMSRGAREVARLIKPWAATNCPLTVSRISAIMKRRCSANILITACTEKCS